MDVSITQNNNLDYGLIKFQYDGNGDMVFNDIFNTSFGLDPNVDKMLFNIKTYIAKYIELDV